MKSLNAKRIAAVAASLVMGLAVAGQGVTFGNVPIINNQGQPVVQIVVGHAAAPSDGVVAANIAAVIGNLALTTQNVTATVTNANSVLSCGGTPTCKITNQQVWLGEKGLSAPSGSYGFQALIGSVLNRAVQLNALQYTKSLQTSSAQYAYPESTSLTASPAASPYTSAGSVPTSTSVVYNYNGGGVTFSSFTQSSSDNLLQITSTQLPALASNFGGNGESEELWLTGFPVFNQQSGVNNFQLLNTGGAYEATFSKPIQNTSTNGATNINVPIQLLGENWTIVNATGSKTTVANQNVEHGGSMWLASSLTPLHTVYVGQNVSNSSVGGFNVQVTDLGQPNSNGLSNAALNVYYDGVLTNVTQMAPFTTQKFNVTGHVLYVHVNQTFAGLYAYQKWAKVQLYSNLVQVRDGSAFNQTGDKGWDVNLLWTNTSTSGYGDALQGIVIYNTSPTTLSPGQGFTFIPNPARYKVTFVGDTLGNNYDPVTFSTSYQATEQYTDNLGSTATYVGATAAGATNVTEPAQLLTVTSQIPNAFTFAGTSSSSVTYDLTPYVFSQVANGLTGGNALTVVLAYTAGNGIAGNYITPTHQLQVQVLGTTNTGSGVQGTVTFTSNSATENLATTGMYNVTGIKLIPSGPLPPGGLSVTVEGASNSLVNLAKLINAAGPTVLYSVSGKNYPYEELASGNTVNYNQPGQPSQPFTVAANATGTQPNVGVGQYFTYTVNELAVPTNSLAEDQLSFGLFNNTGGNTAEPLFQVNYTAAGAQHNNVTYTSSTGADSFAVRSGFRTERGSTVASITPTTDTFDLAKTVDTLQFVVGPVTSSNTALSTTTNYGPYTVGQTTNIANVTIAQVNASCTFSSTTCTVVGTNALVATPSVTQAVVSSHLNTVNTPIAVLDTNANNASSLVVVGSAYVNSVAGQIFAANPQFASSFDNGGASGPNAVTVQAFGNKILVAGYTANQTVTAGNQFITQLLAAAGKA